MNDTCEKLAILFDEVVNQELHHDGKWSELSIAERKAIIKGVQAVLDADPVRQCAEEMADYIEQIDKASTEILRFPTDRPTREQLILARYTQAKKKTRQ